MLLLALASHAFANPRPGWALNGVASGDDMGTALAAGDLDDDGYSDLLVGAPDAGTSNRGEAYIYCGGYGGMYSVVCTTFSASATHTALGAAVAVLGDVSGDGFVDVAVGDPNYTNGSSGEGQARVYEGATYGVSTTLLWSGEANLASAGFGTALAAVGDIDADGFTDFAVGAPGYTSGAYYGYVAVYAGDNVTVGSLLWGVYGDQSGALFGAVLAGGGDVDGDGYDDFVIGSPGYDRSETDEGLAFVYAGGAAALGSSASWTIEADSAGARLGGALDADGDVDDDGFADVLVGGASATVSGAAAAGTAWLYMGSASGPIADWSVEGGAVDEQCGAAVATMDANGDDIADVVVSAPGATSWASGSGEVYTWFGGSGLATLPDQTLSAPLEDGALAAALVDAGDVDLDGFNDLAVGSPGAGSTASGAGRLEVWYGAASGLRLGDWTWTITGEAGDDHGFAAALDLLDIDGDTNDELAVGAFNDDAVYVWQGTTAGYENDEWFTLSGTASTMFGYALEGVGDLDADGFEDLAVGAYAVDNGQTDEGRAYVYFGAFGGVESSIWTFESGQASAYLGQALSGAGDLDADGYDDLAVAAPRYDDGSTDEGAVFVFTGRSSGLSASPWATLEVDQASARLGTALDGGGDLNGDGFADLVASAPYYDDGETNEGAAFGWFGSASGLASTPDWTAESDSASAELGSAIYTQADVDGDGYADAIVGCSQCSTHGTAAGEVWVYLGSAAGPATTPDTKRYGSSAGDEVGASVTAIDLDDDGLPDLVAGAPGYDGQATDGGAIQVWLTSEATSYANITFDSSDASSGLGSALANPGDVDADGSGDLIVGARDFSWGGYPIGRVFDLELADADGDGEYSWEDCDDTDADTYLGAEELCDGLDNDCDGAIDESTPAWYTDADGDGYGDSTTGVRSCTAPAGTVSDADDCDDTDAAVSPAALETCDSVDNNCDGSVDESSTSTTTWYLDADGDGFGDAATTSAGCTEPVGYVSNAADCDDADSSIAPGQGETCDGVDDDCDGSVDEDDAVDATAWFDDDDGDGYGDPLSGSYACAAPTGTSADGGDCDDADPAISPAGVETCNDADDDCDGDTDEGTLLTFFLDADGDDHGIAAGIVEACSLPAGYATTDDDCDDSRSDVNPDASETCDGVDENCDGSVDEGVLLTVWRDTDGDGYGDDAVPDEVCALSAGWSSVPGDCDDADAARSPSAVETCDGVDEDCDGVADDGLAVETWYFDGDGDGYGDPLVGTSACGEPAFSVDNSSDCDDDQASIHPGALEQCDGLDNDCVNGIDGSDSVDAPTWYADQDGDGYGDVSRPTVSCDEPARHVARGGDCDDGDAATHPGASDAWYDDTDSDCAGNDDQDQDGDGAPLGEDCDDEDAEVVSCDSGEPGETADSGLEGETGDTGPRDSGDRSAGACGCESSPTSIPALFAPLLLLGLAQRRRR